MIKRLLDPLFYIENKEKNFKKGGSSPDTSGLEEATKQATALQKQIYEETREDVQPWYNMGTGSVSMLSDLLGISGGSMQSRDQLYDELLPQYTTQQTTGGAGNFYRTPDGQIVDVNDLRNIQNIAGDDFQRITGGPTSYDTWSPEGRESAFESVGWSPFQTQNIEETVDYEGLNSAINEQLGDQATPEGFGSLLERFDIDKFEADPAYQFRQEEAQKALERQMASQGVTVGGGGYGEINPQAMRAMEELSQNLASQEYGSAYDRYNIDKMNTYNMLMGTAGMGQGSTGIMASGGQNYATNVGNLQTGLASAQMNAQLAGDSGGSMFGDLLGAGVQLGSAYMMSDINSKENIEYTGMENGHKMYDFNYKGDNKRYNGVMAQDILESNPDAVVTIGGTLHVDYSRLGVEMKEVV